LAGSAAGRYLFLVIVVLVLLGAATSNAGLTVGIGLVVWGVLAHRMQLRTPIGWVLKRPPSKVAAITTAAFGGLLLLIRLTAAVADYETGVRIKQQHADAEQKRDDARRAALAELPAKVGAWRSSVKAAWDLATATPTKEVVASSLQAVNDVERNASAFATAAFVAGAAPVDFAAVTSEVTDAQTKLKGAADLLSAIDAVDTGIQEGRKHAAAHEWVLADTAYASALGSIQSVGAAPEGLKPFVPSSFNADKKAREVGMLRANISGAVAAEKRRAENEEAKRQAEQQKQALYAALCGEKPTVSGWDGSLIGLESALKETANDPDSIDVKNCTQPLLSSENCWVSTCDVRGKNAFGAKILKRMTFSHSQAGYQELN
jgi:hypothetical protein